MTARNGTTIFRDSISLVITCQRRTTEVAVSIFPRLCALLGHPAINVWRQTQHNRSHHLLWAFLLGPKRFQNKIKMYSQKYNKEEHKTKLSQAKCTDSLLRVCGVFCCHDSQLQNRVLGSHTSSTSSDLAMTSLPGIGRYRLQQLGLAGHWTGSGWSHGGWGGASMC